MKDFDQFLRLVRERSRADLRQDDLTSAFQVLVEEMVIATRVQENIIERIDQIDDRLKWLTEEARELRQRLGKNG